MKKQYLSLNVIDWADPVGNVIEYDLSKRKWVVDAEVHTSFLRSGFPCKSYKAALRHLRKHNEIPRGTKFILVNKWCGFDMYLTKK